MPAPQLAEVVAHLNGGVAIEERARSIVACAEILAVRNPAGPTIIELEQRNHVELH